MNKKQLHQKLKPRHGKIAGHHCLHTLLTSNPHTHVSLLHHTDIISSVANGQRHLIEIDFHQVDDGRFLKGRGPTADDAMTSLGHFEEEALEGGVYGVLERRTVDDESFWLSAETDGTAVARVLVSEDLLEEGDSREKGV